MNYRKNIIDSIHISILPVLLSICLVLNSFLGCSIQSQHLEVTYEENSNESINDWENVQTNQISWENGNIVTWDDVEEYSDLVYSVILFEDIAESMPLIDCKIIDFQENGLYFDGEKVYSMVGDRFDVNSFVSKYAIGTGVIVVCLILSVATMNTPVACFFAGAADAAISEAVKQSALVATTKAVMAAIKSEGDIEDTLYGALEGSSEGYMWGAIYGAATGGFSNKYCFAGDTLVKTEYGMKPITSVCVGDRVCSYNEESHMLSYEVVTQITKGYSNQIVDIVTKDGHIVCTSTHPFLTNEGWKMASELSAEYSLVNDRLDHIGIESVKSYISSESVETYSLCVSNDHTYFVGNSCVIVHNRCNPNEKHADTQRLFDDGSELAEKYPNGVYIKPSGYPDFTPYATKTVTFEAPTNAGVSAGKCLRGDCYYDFKMANKAAFGIDSVSATPKGFTWHHCEDGRTMQLIPSDLHRGIGHDGGEKVIKLLLSGY